MAVSAMRITLTEVQILPEFQVREKTSQSVIKAYAKQMAEAAESGETADFPPLKVIALDNGTYGLVGGAHRYEAAKLADQVYVDVLVYPQDTPKADLIEVCIADNLHGLKLGKIDQIRAVEMLDIARPGLSARHVGRIVGISSHTVKTYREAIVAKAQQGEQGEQPEKPAEKPKKPNPELQKATEEIDALKAKIADMEAKGAKQWKQVRRCTDKALQALEDATGDKSDRIQVAISWLSQTFIVPDVEADDEIQTVKISQIVDAADNDDTVDTADVDDEASQIDLERWQKIVETSKRATPKNEALPLLLESLTDKLQTCADSIAATGSGELEQIKDGIENQRGWRDWTKSEQHTTKREAISSSIRGFFDDCHKLPNIKTKKNTRGAQPRKKAVK